MDKVNNTQQDIARDEIDSINAIGLTLTLNHISNRLLSIEKTLSENKVEPQSKPMVFIELSKIIFGGWPALGVLFLLLFFSPLKEALNAIPEKVRSANEIAMLGVSLKSTIQSEATKMGESNLSDTIPRLSGPAIELLLQLPSKRNSLVTFTPSDDGKSRAAINFPKTEKLKILEELQNNGLVGVHPDWFDKEKLTYKDIQNIISDFHNEFPGHEEEDSDGLSWVFETPVSDEADYPQFTTELTSLGETAVDVILKAISSELSHDKK